MPRLKDAELSQITLQCAISIVKCPCDFILNTEHKPHSGGECTIFAFEAKSSNRERISMLLEHTPSPNIFAKMEQEVRHLGAIRAANLAYLPEFLGCSILLTLSPFIALKWAEGMSLKWTDSSPTPECRGPDS